MSRKLYTSDTHFGHVNIVKYMPESRPFKDVDEMNAELVKLWNSKVNPEDTVYVVGDFAMGPKTNVPLFRKQLNGKVVLVRGNHDRSKSYCLESGFDEVHDSLVVEDGGKTLWLHHQPILFPDHWPVRADYHFCGHVHSEWARRNNVINVGVDVSGLIPLTLEELEVRDLVICNWCGGTGKTKNTNPCPNCYGVGVQIDERNGKVHRKPGEGNRYTAESL